MNDELQASLTTTGSMATATGKQLKILQAQQAEHTAKQAKKPKLIARIATVPVNGSGLAIPIREQTGTTIILDFGLANGGDAKAAAVPLRLGIFAKDVALQSVSRSASFPRHTTHGARLRDAHRLDQPAWKHPHDPHVYLSERSINLPSPLQSRRERDRHRYTARSPKP